MKILIISVTILVTCAIQSDAHSINNRNSTISKRQAANADQMVQNILQWVQNVYTQNSRKIRQGTLRQYLPPANTEKPRPFQPGYPPAGETPQPPFPFPTSPVTGGVTAPEQPQPQPEDGNEVLLPPTRNGFNPPDEPEQHEVPLPTEGPSEGPLTTGPVEQPSETPVVPQEQPRYPSIHPDVPNVPIYTDGPTYPTTESAGIPSDTPSPEEKPAVPGYPNIHPDVPFLTEATEPPSEQPRTTPQAPEEPEGPKEPELPSRLFPEIPETPQKPNVSLVPGGQHESTTEQLYTSPHEDQAGTSTVGPTLHTDALPYTSSNGYTQPSDVSTGYPEAGQSIPQVDLTPSTALPEGTTPRAEQTSPSETKPVETSEYQTEVPVTPEGPALTTSESVTQEGRLKSEEPVSIHAGTTLAPSGFTASTPSETEGELKTTENPEANTIPGNAESSVAADDDSKHPPHIHSLDVICGKEMMTITIEFNREFNGIIYSKGHFSNNECRYVPENSGQTKYTFTVSLNTCGTEFVNAFDTQNQSYLENVLVLQNEAGIQEVWDTVRSVRCLWEGNIKDTLRAAFSIGMLSQEIVTFSGDTAMAKLDVLLGRGPFGEPANGLVKIGEQMTLAVSVSGDPGFDLQVKDCKAIDSDEKNIIALTDEDGCVLKPKVFGAFQKTRETGSTGASIIAYAYFNAFKFPDIMDLTIECNIELCKTDCDMCSKENQQLEPSKRRRRDVSAANASLSDGTIMGKRLQIILPEDINEKTVLELSTKDHVCISTQNFLFSSTVLISLALVSSSFSICLWLRRREKYLP
ncbi:uncharacterized protein LOC115876512 isoform X2 [Sitophilus oryzae]|nr:uncharacterized protein LOC115876512 isoform X2 [Sitophilus oryzae]XP_030748176.1 uncharacterized protein LOC115876512 isoform X2 [Sitophilus oryzae]XP_030748177.1 uncharacterized protein LOC115876512 isoform X2 [Sitophilus oryzae]XP_030748178.1 uncharacterized protein LOC115876512 isoform X2 [Sitophilus oryzae]